MKERKKRLKQLLAAALALVVIGGSVNLPALTSFAEDGDSEQVDLLTSEEDGEAPEAEEDKKEPEEKQPEDKGQESSQTGKPEDEATEKPEDNQEANGGLVEETMDLSGYIYQCGGFGVMDMPMMLSLDDESGARAASDKEAAKTALLNGMKAWEKKIDLSAYQISNDEMEVLFVDLVNMNPDLFYVVSATWSSIQATGIVVSVTPIYNPAYTVQNVQIFENAFNKAYSEAVPNPAGMSKLQIARA